MRQKSIKLFVVLFLCLVGLSAYSQDIRTVRGRVVDQSGMVLPGVSIMEKGTANGTVTDFDGNFSIRVKETSYLVFSYLGMKTQELLVKNKQDLEISLVEDFSALDEVVVVGYGSQKKGNITGAIATINPEDIQDLPVTNLSEALVGQIPGVSISGGSSRPGDAAAIQIRQTFSFGKDGGTSIPLVVIDDMVQIDPETGKPSMEAFNRLDPTEIESITVLKDASAAIYGSRASQGAIVVKTKRGKKGKPKFSFLSQFSYNDAVSHSKTMSAYDFGIWHNRYLKADNRDNNGANLFSTEELEKMKGLDYDWLDEAWSAAAQQKYAMNVSGGTDAATYFAGLTYLTQGANLGEQDYDKMNFRAGINANLSSDFDLSASISGNTGSVEKSFTKATANINDSSYGSKAGGGEQGDYGYLLHMPKYVPWETTIDGEDYYMSPFPRTDRNLQSANTNRTIAGWNYFATLNNGSKQTTDDFSYNANVSLTYKVPFVKGLTFKGTYARTENSTYTEQVQLPYDLVRITNYNSEGNHLENPDSKYKFETNARNSRVYYNTARNKSYQLNFFANYARTFGDHDISAMASIEKSESSYNSTRLAYENTSKDYLGTNQTAGTLSDNSTAFKGESGVLSYLGRVNYSYQDKYLLQFLFRSDASTKFAPENYWGFFPSAQAGWVMSKENWFEESLPWVDFFKLRYSIGKTGNDNLKPWLWKQYYDIYTDKGFQFGSNGGTLGGGLSPKVNPNRDARWDTTIKQNFGFDLNVLDNRLQIGTEFYYDKYSDMFTDMAGALGVPISVGGGYAEQNYGEVDAWGSEYSINWRDRVGNDFSYNVGLNFGYSNNKVKKYPEQARNYPSDNIKEVGNSLIYPAWGFHTWNGTSTGDGILRTDDDVLNYWNYLTERATAAGTTPSYLGINDISGVRKGMLAYQDVAGNYDPTTGKQEGANGQVLKGEDYVKLAEQNRTYGFTTNLGAKYKSLYLRAQIQTSWGGVRMIDIVKQGTSSSHNMWAHESYWSDMYDEDDNVDAKYPNLAYYDQISADSNFWQVNTFRSYVKSMTFGCELPKKVLSAAHIQRGTIGVTGFNLWDFYNPYPDKYRNMYDNSYVGYPTLRTWTVNLNLTF